MDPVKTALIGYGFSARTFHLPFLRSLDDYHLTAVSSRQRERVTTDLPKVELFAQAETMIDHSDAELMIITAPNDVHFALARRALERNKHVILEKPFVTSTDEGEQLIELAAQQGRLLSVYHNRRWDGDFLTLKQLLADGRLGDIHRFESHFDRFRPQVRARWRELPGRGAGIWFDLGPHLVDQALQLFGAPEAVTARCGALRDGSQATDYFHVQLHYPGLEVILESSPYCAGPNRRFELQGSNGSYRKYGLDPQEPRLIAGAMPTTDSWGQEAQEAFGTLYRADSSETIPTRCGGYQHYYRAIAAALRGEAPNPVPATEALLGIRLLELAEASNEAGRTLPFIP